MSGIFPTKSYLGIGWIAVTVLISCALMGSAQAVESGGIGGRPARPDAANPRTESIFVFDMEQGQEAENAVRIYNNSGTQKTISVYAVDSQISSGGAFACAQKVEERRRVGNWITLRKDKVTLPSGGSEEVAFTLAVPSQTPGGEHNGCIVIQEENQKPTAAGNGIALSFRSAIRLAVTVKGDIKKELAFTRLQNTEKNDKLIINTALRNSGNVSLDTNIDARIKSLLGLTVRKTGGEFPILAGGESEFNLETSKPFWGGLYLLSAQASYNNDPHANLGTGQQNARVSQTKIFWVSPKPLAALIEASVPLIGIAGGIFYWRRYRHRKKWHKEGKIYVVRQGETLPHIAEKFGLSWKAIARANHLKAPYHLRSGDRLKLLPTQSGTAPKSPQRRLDKSRE